MDFFRNSTHILLYFLEILRLFGILSRLHFFTFLNFSKIDGFFHTIFRVYEEFLSCETSENAPVWKFTLLKSILKSAIMFFNIEPRCSAVWLSSSLSVESTREIKLKAVDNWGSLINLFFGFHLESKICRNFYLDLQNAL